MPKTLRAGDDRAKSEQSMSAAARILKTAGSIVAPSTILIALLFYFGWLHAYWFCYYFGVNSTILGFSLEDYLIRSADGLFVPLVVVAGIGLLGVWSHRLIRVYPKGKKVRQIIAVGALVVGAALSTTGILNIFSPRVFKLGLAVAPLILAAGVLLLMFASHSLRAGKVRASETALAEWAGVFAVVSICAFWAAGDYAGAVGIGRGQQVQAELHGYPNTTLYSAKSLSLTGPGITKTTCPEVEAAYRFRYDGLKLILQSGNQYFFLPQGWTPEIGAAIIIPRTDSVRLEFTAASGDTHGRSCVG